MRGWLLYRTLCERVLPDYYAAGYRLDLDSSDSGQLWLNSKTGRRVFLDVSGEDHDKPERTDLPIAVADLLRSTAAIPSTDHVLNAAFRATLLLPIDTQVAAATAYGALSAAAYRVALALPGIGDTLYTPDRYSHAEVFEAVGEVVDRDLTALSAVGADCLNRITRGLPASPSHSETQRYDATIAMSELADELCDSHHSTRVTELDAVLDPDAIIDCLRCRVPLLLSFPSALILADVTARMPSP